MENETSEQKEIIINDININDQIINEDSNKTEKENIPENNNKEENNIDSEPKLILKKKVNKLKKPLENNNDQIEIPNIEIEINNNINEKNEEIKIEKEKNNMGYLDDDLEDEDNKKLYLRVIKRMEKTYGVPIISAKIEGEPIKDIGLEDNIRPILIGKDIKNQNDIDKNKSSNIKLRNNIKINNYINNSNNNYINNNNNLFNSQNFNYRANDYNINNPILYNKNIYNNSIPKKYNNYLNTKFKASILYHPRKFSYERMDKNYQKRFCNKYPIYKISYNINVNTIKPEGFE